MAGLVVAPVPAPVGDAALIGSDPLLQLHDLETALSLFRSLFRSPVRFLFAWFHEEPPFRNETRNQRWARSNSLRDGWSPVPAGTLSAPLVPPWLRATMRGAVAAAGTHPFSVRIVVTIRVAAGRDPLLQLLDPEAALLSIVAFLGRLPRFDFAWFHGEPPSRN